MKVLSLFSGVGGFDLGLERAGMETVFQCEWDKQCRAILDRHWPTVPKWDDVSTLTGAHILEHAPVIDVVAWGSPCQDLSVAGKRAGLQGERSGLFHQGVRIIKELRELTNGKYPRVSIWENVAGALSSSDGADFGQVLYEMDEAGACFSEWRLLDAQYFGVPQRRRRVFVVSIFDPGIAARCPNPLLPVSEGVRGDSEEGAASGEAVTREIAGCLRSGGAGGVPSSRGEHLVVAHRMLSFGHYADDDTASAIKARDYKDATDLVVSPFTPSSFAQYEAGVGTLRSNGGDLGGGSETLVTFTKSKRAQSVNDNETWVEGEPAPTPNAFDVGDTRTTAVVVGSLQARDYKGTNHEGARDGKLIMEPLMLDGRRVDDVRVYDPPVQTLQARMGTGGNNVPMIAFSHAQGLSAQPSETAWPTLRKEGAGHAVALDMAVRRLTPVECERLMGWPDDWTAGQADTHRYKQCGNGVASPVATWIGEQLINL